MQAAVHNILILQRHLVSCRTLRSVRAEAAHAWQAAPLRLNNRYFLDGRDANSFTNVAWLFGLHDRPWGPRNVFGNVRSMGQNSLRKFDADAYVRAVEALAAE